MSSFVFNCIFYSICFIIEQTVLWLYTEMSTLFCNYWDINIIFTFEHKICTVQRTFSWSKDYLSLYCRWWSHIKIEHSSQYIKNIFFFSHEIHWFHLWMYIRKLKMQGMGKKAAKPKTCIQFLLDMSRARIICGPNYHLTMVSYSISKKSYTFSKVYQYSFIFRTIQLKRCFKKLIHF